MSGHGSTAAMRYKEIVSLISKSATELRSWEMERAEKITAEIAAAEEAVAIATERAERAKQSANRWWRMAEDNVMRLPWLEIPEFLAPAPQARAERLDKYLEDTRVTYNELVQSVLQLSWRARK